MTQKYSCGCQEEEWTVVVEIPVEDREEAEILAEQFREALRKATILIFREPPVYRTNPVEEL